MAELIKILITNDDGIDSPGISALVHEIKKFGEPIVIAPDRQQSAVGHALTVAKPLRATPFHRNGEMFGFAINGTPSDSVKLALSALLTEKPDLLISGINHGPNTCINVLYSGTVSAATEGMLLGIPSIAISIDSYDYRTDCSIAAEYATYIARNVVRMGLPKDTLLNVNVPNLPKDEIKGIKITRLGRNIWSDNYERRIDPWGRAYYWFAGELDNEDDDENTDLNALRNGFVSVTPVKYQFGNQDDVVLNKLRTIENKIL
jgi:5'-nucleotidase